MFYGYDETLLCSSRNNRVLSDSSVRQVVPALAGGCVNQKVTKKKKNNS